MCLNRKLDAAQEKKSALARHLAADGGLVELTLCGFYEELCDAVLESGNGDRRFIATTGLQCRQQHAHYLVYIQHSSTDLVGLRAVVKFSRIPPPIVAPATFATPRIR